MNSCWFKVYISGGCGQFGSLLCLFLVLISAVILLYLQISKENIIINLRYKTQIVYLFTLLTSPDDYISKQVLLQWSKSMLKSAWFFFCKVRYEGNRIVYGFKLNYKQAQLCNDQLGITQILELFGLDRIIPNLV